MLSFSFRAPPTFPDTFSGYSITAEAYASDNSYGIFTDRSIFRLLFPRNRSVPGLHERAPVRKSDFFLVSLLLVK